MCGIVAVLNFNEDRVDELKLTQSRDRLIHRGPDFGANFILNNIGLAHRRLSIIDLSSEANQPFISTDRNFVITFNGEIYNYLDLKKDLEGKGFVFRSKSDTEVLLNLYICYGYEMLHMLNGMFAFAIWDNIKKELFVARDRVGIKPLFYSINDLMFVCASEIKAILGVYHEPEIIEDRLNELMLYRHINGENSLFKNVFRLLPGHFMVVTSKGIIKKQQWWNLKDKIQNHYKISNPKDWFFNTFNNSVKCHMVSDVPVGVLLSGGLDSSSICASLKYQNFENISTFNVGFENFKFDETKIARDFTKYINYPFNSINITGNSLVENTLASLIHLGDTLVHQNEPQLIGISELANKKVKVLLSGEGSDELLGGYVRYKALKLYNHKNFLRLPLSLLPNYFRSHRINKLEKYLQLISMDHAIQFNAVNNYPTEFEKIGIQAFEINNEYRTNILKDGKELYPKNAIRQAMYLDMHTYLCTLNDRNDRTTMAASIECRVPFLNHELIEGLGTLDDDLFARGKKGKYLLTETFKNILPSSVLNFQKVGFSVPWIRYIKENSFFLDHWNTMQNSDLLKMGLYQLVDIKHLKNQLEKGDTASESMLLQAFFLSLWHKHYLSALKQT